MIGQPCTRNMESDAFISMMSSPDFVGDPLIRTQHLLGGVSYEMKALLLLESNNFVSRVLTNLTHFILINILP